MKKIIFYLLYVSFLVSTISADSKISGLWGGFGVQNNGSAWTIKMLFKNDRYLIEYPSIPCSGELHLLSKTNNKYIFREVITKHKNNCVNNGKLVLTLIDSNTLDWKWHDPNDGHITATTVKRYSNLKELNANVSPLLENYRQQHPRHNNDGRDEVAALGILLGGALLYKGAQVIGELFSSTSSSSSSSYSSSSSSLGSRYITDFGIEAPRSDWDRDTVWYRVSIKINDGSRIWAHVQRKNGCYELGVGSVDSNIYGNCTNCFNNINEYWSCHANGGGNFNIQGDQVDATKAIVERSR